MNAASINADSPSPNMIAYATTKGAIQNFTGGLAQLLADKHIRANCVAPGPIWTPLIPSTMPSDKVMNFGSQVPMKRPGQPAELAPAYVMHARPDGRGKDLVDRLKEMIEARDDPAAMGVQAAHNGGLFGAFSPFAW